MRRKLLLVLISSLLLPAGAAFADRGHRGGKHGGKHDRDRIVVRDHRDNDRRGPAVRDHRDGGRPDGHGPRVKHVRVNNGRYVFPGGVVRVYKRPVIRQRYTDVRVRPAVIVEQYDPVPGYVWVRGNWTWGGGEWVWTPGYWSVAAEPVYVAPPPPPTARVQGGISVSGGITIR